LAINLRGETSERPMSIPAHYYPQPAPRTETVQRIERAEAFFAVTNAKVMHGGRPGARRAAVDWRREALMALAEKRLAARRAQIADRQRLRALQRAASRDQLER
jgi:hypothetical protein